MNDRIQPPPEWCEGNDLDNFVLLLERLKGSLADDRQDPRQDPRPPQGAGDPSGH